jgi:ribosome-binding ATPase YchF (GTP1/OBG family)
MSAGGTSTCLIALSGRTEEHHARLEAYVSKLQMRRHMKIRNLLLMGLFPLLIACNQSSDEGSAADSASQTMEEVSEKAGSAMDSAQEEAEALAAEAEEAARETAAAAEEEARKLAEEAEAAAREAAEDGTTAAESAMDDASEEASGLVPN